MQFINSQTNEIEAKSTLNQNSVKKLMHLIVNPLENVISRFNSQHDDTTNKSLQIFKSWCKTLDQKIYENIKQICRK